MLPRRCKKNADCEHAENVICQNCFIPICFDCWWHMEYSKGSRVPQALANDNFQGYAHAFIVKNQVRWIEVVAACPLFTSIIVYYIEGEKQHLVNTDLGSQERTYVVRGNVFSFLMPWEQIQMHMHEFVIDEEMSTWPLPRYRFGSSSTRSCFLS